MISDEDGIESCVPCGFLGYPVPEYGAEKKIDLAYSTKFDDSIKSKRQYFGLNSDILDEDILNYKGENAYNNKTFDFNTAANKDIVLKAKWEKVSQNNANESTDTNLDSSKKIIIIIIISSIILILIITLIIFKNIKKKINKAKIKQ